MKKKRNVYLKMKTLEEAKKILFDEFAVFGKSPGEMVPAPDAVGRVLAEPVFAKVSSPNFHAAAMDGIAVKALDTFGASETKPKELIVGKEAFFVNTGHTLPPETDAVIIIEKVQIIDEKTVRIEAPSFPWQNIRKMGEDIVATELLFPRNHLVTPYCLGALLGGGVFEVCARKRPKVLIIPTGSEIVDWRKTPLCDVKAGQVIESNSYVLVKLVKECGGVGIKHDVAVDDPNLITEIIEKGVKGDFDIIMTIGGSSAGSEDYTKEAVENLGKILVHGATIMPGKPVLIGKVDGKPVIGMPGYPVSMIVAFEQFVRPLIYGMLGLPEPEKQTLEVEPTRKIPSKLGVEEFLRVKLGKVGKKIVATTLPRGAGSITSITEADGIIRIPINSEGILENEKTTAELLRPASAIENTIVAVGSHDNTLDILADELKRRRENITLSSSHVGSMGGLMAIKRGVCHIAGSHLLDTEDGSYNLSYIKRFLPDLDVKLINLVFREQGLIISPGNPKNIKGISDLVRDDIKFINRQSGSGTRILLDYELKKAGIDPSDINGYENEEFTHMSVAVAVLSGTVDAGLGIYAAAKALNLDFIPIVTEEYDLIIPEIYFNTENIKIFLDTISSPEFKKRVKSLGGYHTDSTGEIIQ